MLFRFIKKLDEEFASDYTRDNHYKDHNEPTNKNKSAFAEGQYKTPEAYEKAADALAAAFCRTSDPNNRTDKVLGFIGKDGYYYKFDTKFETFVVYKPDKDFPSGNVIITFYPPKDESETQDPHYARKFYKRKYDQYYLKDFPQPPKKKKDKKKKE